MKNLDLPAASHACPSAYPTTPLDILSDALPSTRQDWQAAWQHDFSATAQALLAAQADRIAAHAQGDAPAWISLTPLATLSQALDALRDRAPSPLWGVPFAVKDNIDVAGLPTTAACVEFAYTPEQSATAVELLTRAGALCLGKTNLDQFATGLNGTRSPFGIPRSVFDTRYISGGSSSGSAVAVADGSVVFALGTDTAGSGRVPAACNELFGIKPSKGLISTLGVVPACRTLDCVSIFSRTLADGEAVSRVLACFDARDPYARHAPIFPARLGAMPKLVTFASLDFFGDAAQQAAWQNWRETLAAQGFCLSEIDPTPFLALAPLLYGGPWVAERLAALAPFMAEHAEAVHPVVRGIIEGGREYSAVDAFTAEYQRAEFTRQIHAVLAPFDALVLPTAPIFPTVEAVLAEPMARNSELGAYTNFVNLADLCALALPAGRRADGLPFGATLIAPAFHDESLIELAARLCGETPALSPERLSHEPLRPQELAIAVVGAHLTGMPLNHQLTHRGGRLLQATTTAPSYRLYALANTTPPKPGLVFDANGSAIALEVWALPRPAVADFLAEIPAPLGLGQLTLADGSQVTGFICEPRALAEAEDVTHFGGWKAYRAAATARSCPPSIAPEQRHV